MRYKVKALSLTLAALFLALCLTSVNAETLQPNSWSELAPMHVARSDLGVAVVNGKIYAIGGNTESGYMPHSDRNDYSRLGWINDTNEEYDPKTDTWTFKTPMPTPRSNFAIAVFENKIYCIGGIINWSYGKISFTGVNEVYDPATDTWETKTPMPNPSSASASVVKGRIYVIGGGVDNQTLNQVYDPSTDIWTIKKPIPTTLGGVPNAMPFVLSAKVNDKIYVIRYYNSYYGSKPSGTWIYNPANDSWASMLSSPFPLLGDPSASWWSQATGATTGVNTLKRIYVFFENFYLNSHSIPLLAFDQSSESWASIGELPTSRCRFGVAVVNDTLYAIGGRTYDYPGPNDNPFFVTEHAVNERYTPIGYGTPDPTYDGTPPEIAVLSPENITYHIVDVALNFTVNETASSMSYMLDGEVFEVSANTTLTGLPYGSHNLTVYATDAANNTGSSETINFAVAQEPAPFPVVPVVVVVLVILVSLILLYIRLRYRKISSLNKVAN